MQKAIKITASHYCWFLITSLSDQSEQHSSSVAVTIGRHLFLLRTLQKTNAQRSQRNFHFFTAVEQKNARHNRKKAGQIAYAVSGSQLVPFFEENRRSDDDKSGVEDIKDRGHHWRREDVQGAIQIVHLRQ